METGLILQVVMWQGVGGRNRARLILCGQLLWLPCCIQGSGGEKILEKENIPEEPGGSSVDPGGSGMFWQVLQVLRDSGGSGRFCLSDLNRLWGSALPASTKPQAEVRISAQHPKHLQLRFGVSAAARVLTDPKS